MLRALPACLLIAVGCMTPPQAQAAVRFRDGHGLRVLAERQIDARLLALTVASAALQGRPTANPAVNGPANVRILLPSGYDTHPRRRYPVLYLMHGTSGGAADWTQFGGAEQTTVGLPLIVVMPDIALADTGGGWCTNWVNGGTYGPPEWETFHIDDLIPWIDANLRTIADRSGRAIAGLSQGGFCSMSYAARHPDLFRAALSFSGAPDIAYDKAAWGPSTTIINATETLLDDVPADSMFGPRSTDELNWADHDPATLANNLRGMDLLMYTGDGQPGPLDSPPVNPGAETIEALVHEDTVLFHDRLEQLHIRSYFDDYGPGTHSWPYWARDLRQSIGRVMADFAHPLPAPRAVTYTIADPRYSAFGWSVTMHRRAQEFSTLERAGSRGFALAGSGSATVLTARFFRPGARYRVKLKGRPVVLTELLVADSGGRLEIQVPLGPSNRAQEFTAGVRTVVFTTRVRISGPSVDPAR